MGVGHWAGWSAVRGVPVGIYGGEITAETGYKKCPLFRIILARVYQYSITIRIRRK